MIYKLRFNVPDTDTNIRFVESKAKTYTAIPTIAQGTLLKLIERVTYHKYTGNYEVIYNTFYVDLLSKSSVNIAISIFGSRIESFCY